MPVMDPTMIQMLPMNKREGETFMFYPLFSQDNRPANGDKIETQGKGPHPTISFNHARYGIGSPSGSFS